MEEQKATEKKRKIPRWRKAFLTSLAMQGKVTKACEDAKIERPWVYRQRWEDPEFEEEWERALQCSGGLLEDEARRRAYEGLIKYKYDKKGDPLKHPVTGEPYYEIDYSDTLIMFLLKRIFPNKYKDNLKVDQNVNSNVKVDATVDTTVRMTDECNEYLEAYDKEMEAETGSPEGDRSANDPSS